MEKLTLKLSDLLQLESEINGFRNPQNGQTIFVGFRNHKLSLTTKYWLSQLGESIAHERKAVDELRDELIQKHGETMEDGSTQIGMFIEKKGEDEQVISRELNPTYIEFQREFNELLSQEREIEYNPLTMSDLERAGETSDNYNMLFTLVAQPE